jgi:four helix bundle protein
MASIESYRDLEAWQSAIDLSFETFALASQLPGSERFELGGQMRKAGVSVPSNVAEGQASGPGRRYLHHVDIALGSLAELDTQVEIIRRRQLVSGPGLQSIDKLLQQTGKLIHGLRRSIWRRLQIKVGCFAFVTCACSGSTLLFSEFENFPR